MMDGDYGSGLWGGGFPMVLFWLAVAGLGIWGLRMLFPDGHSAPAAPPTSALDIARVRYSRGERSRDDYLALVEDLKQTKETTR
jgi:uncharacterized membrane protein